MLREGAATPRSPYYGYYTSTTAPSGHAMSTNGFHNPSANLHTHSYTGSLSGDHLQQAIYSTASTSAGPRTQAFAQEHLQHSSRGSYGRPVQGNTLPVGNSQYPPKIIQRAPTGQMFATTHRQSVPTHMVRSHPQHDPSFAHQSSQTPVVSGAPQQGLHTQGHLTSGYSADLLPVLGELLDMTGDVHVPLVIYGDFEFKYGDLNMDEPPPHDDTHRAVSNLHVAKRRRVQEDAGEADSPTTVPQTHNPPASPHSSTGALSKISEGEGTMIAAQSIRVRRQRVEQYKRPWGLQRFLMQTFVEQAAATHNVPVPKILNEDIMGYCNTHWKAFHQINSPFTPYHVDIRLLGNVEITVEEILTFFPDHLKWHDAIFRLTQNGWGATNISKYTNHARGLLHPDDSRRSGVAKYQKSADESHIEPRSYRLQICASDFQDDQLHREELGPVPEPSKLQGAH